MIRVGRIVAETLAEGPGRRFAIWVQGCKLHCKGCYAKEFWSLDGGTAVTVEKLNSMIADKAKAVEGITLLGGEPFLQAQELAKTAHFAQSLGLSVITFSGATKEQLELSESPGVHGLLACTDILIDGPYIEEQRDFSRPLVGSKNQKYHFLSGKYTADDIKNYRNKMEFRIDKDGILRVNGMGDFDAVGQILK